MKWDKYRFVALAFSLFTLTGTLPTSLAESSADKPIVKIGIITPLSGNMAHVGKSFQNGATLALEDLQKKPFRYRYEVIFEDNHFDSVSSALAAQKLINVDKVDVLISTWDSCGLAVAPISAKSKVVHFGTAWTDRVLIGPFNFNMATPPGEQAEKMVQELKNCGLTRVAILHEITDGADVIMETFQKEFPAAGISIVDEIRFTSQERDFRTLFAKAEQHHPQIYYINAFSPQLELIGKQHHEMKIQAPLTTCEAFDETQEKSIFEGDWFVAPAMPPQEYLDQYKKRFSMEMIGSVTLTYNIIELVAQIYEQEPQRPDAAKLAELLGNTHEFEGLAGKVFQKSPHFFTAPAAVKMIKDGRSVTKEDSH